MTAARVTAGPGRSILFVLDLSYSMNLTEPSSGFTRIESARNAVGGILDDAGGDEEWALIGVSDKSKIEILAPVTGSAKEILAALQRRKPWGTASLSASLRTAISYLKTAARSPVGAVVLLSDCLSTEGDFPVDGLRELFDGAGIRLFIVGFPVEDNPETLLAPAALARATQGGFFLPADLSALSLRLRVMAPRSPPAAGNPAAAPADLPAAAAPVTREATTGGSRMASTVPVALLWGLAAIGAILMALLLRAVLFPAAGTEPKRIGVFHFEILSPPRERRIVSLKNASVSIGTLPECDLRVGKAAAAASGSLPRTASGTAIPTGERLTVALEDGLVTLRSESGVLVNGVLRHDKKLKDGDLIRIDGTRIAYRGLDLEDMEPHRVPRSLPRLLFTAAGLLLVLLLAVFFTIRAGAARHAVDRGGMTGTAPAAASGTAPAAASGTASAAASEEPHPVPRSTPILIAPGEAVPAMKADILLVHSHPDDESIDFGCLIAKASRSGKTVVQVTLTDGESGLDHHEERDETHTLPEQKLTGKDLADVRIHEERNALSVLGARAYVRLGLRNHPYNTAAQVVPRSQLLSDWGGEAEVVGRIVALLEALQPEIVVSPDRRSAAKEHFEHEAVGDLVRTAISMAQRRGKVSLKGHVVSVDPRQRSAYRGLVTVDGMERDPLTGLPFREIQSRALAEHMTQRDASVIGREILANFRFEYYLPVFWKLPVSLDEWLSG